MFVVGMTLVAGALPATANAPPTAAADAPREALLDERVLFRDASVDPDGEIVAVAWEFSDGRTLEGSSVTKVLAYAGVHSITLRVRDDDGASAETTFEVLVHAPAMQGRATALRVGDATLGDTGEVRTTQHEDHADAVGEAGRGQLRVAALETSLRTLEHRAVARADIGWAYIPVPIGYVLLTGIEAEAIVGCAYPTIANAKFTQLRLNDGPLVPPGDVAPNTHVALPGGGSLTLNAQEWVGDKLAVTASRHVAADGVVTELARAEAGVSHCPFAG